ncbi:MAG TPA: adenylate/guanylate cyclase domain-containing protein [Elusimicrobiota bacterium]|jgi:class 3 adenylate cyclase|nr:adenylate/guanylate cyclase domain-containing protein [Elusimicrobiota bacterium]
MPSKTLAIMFTDIKGFTARTSDSSREAVQKLLSEHDRLLAPAFRHLQGNVVKTIGDAFLVWFESPTNAVLCGLLVQEVLRQHNESVPEAERIQVRVAVNLGEVELVAGDVLGEPVNLAARLEGIAEAGEVWFTESVYLAMNRKEVPSASIGERTFKGIPYPVRVYRVIIDPKSEHVRRLRESVKVTKDGVSISGLRPGDVSARKKAKIAAAVVGLLAAAFVLLGAFGRLIENGAVRGAQELAARGEPSAALDIMDDALRHNPMSRRLRDESIKIARDNVARLLREGKAQEARDWLGLEVSKRSSLASLTEDLRALPAPKP